MSTNIDMGLDEIIKMNRKGAQKKMRSNKQANSTQHQRIGNSVRAQKGFKTTPGKKPFKQTGQPALQRRRPIDNRNRSQTLRGGRQQTSRQMVRDGIKSQQRNDRSNTVNRKRNLPTVNIVSTTSKKPLARTGVLQSDILARELEMKQKVLKLKTTLDASRSKRTTAQTTRNQPPAQNRMRNLAGPMRTRGGRNLGGVAATTLTVQVPNRNQRLNRHNVRGNARINPVMTKQVTQIQTQIKSLQNKLTNIQKRQLFQIQKQGNQGRRQQRQTLGNRVQPRVSVQNRIQPGRNTQAGRRKVVW